MQFQANPDGRILSQNDIELCEASGSLTACWTILRSEIKVNSIHRVGLFRANYFSIVHKFVEKKISGREQGGGVTTPKNPLLDPCLLTISDVFPHLSEFSI
jgi:hypothetical protein